MRLNRGIIAGIGMVALAGCGAATSSSNSLTSPTPSPVATSPTATPASTATPTPANTLVISQLGLQMTIPSGLNQVTYKIQSPGFASLTDHSGMSHTPLGQIAISTTDCSGGATIAVTVWDVDPVILSGQGYGGTVPGSDTHVGNRYLHIEGGDGFPPANCSAATTALLQQLVASATATS
jgi:hypothetical protein